MDPETLHGGRVISEAAAVEPVDELADQVSRTTGLPAEVARRVVADVLAYFTETTEEYVRRRHRELEASLPKRFGGKLGIGHTRWATHGGPSKDNAHPHASGNERIAVVHNGIFDNAAAIRTQLEDAGVKLRSETDTEVLAHLIEQADGATLEEKVMAALRRIEGTYGIAVIDLDFPDGIVAARN